MLWESVKRNKGSFLLVLTILIGFLSTSFDFPTGKHIHWDGSMGMSHKWFAWVVGNYLIGFIMLILPFCGLSKLDRVVLVTYLVFDLIGFLSYLYQGWPEPKELLIAWFCLTLIIIIVHLTFKK